MSPSEEEHIEVLDSVFGFGVEYVKPLIQVSFSSVNSGNALKFHKQTSRNKDFLFSD